MFCGCWDWAQLSSRSFKSFHTNAKALSALLIRETSKKAWMWKEKQQLKIPASGFEFSKACLLWPASAIPFFLSLEVWNWLVAGICSVVCANCSICVNSGSPAWEFNNTFPSAGRKMKVPLSGTLKLCKAHGVEFEHRAGRFAPAQGCSVPSARDQPRLELAMWFGGCTLKAPHGMPKSALAN